MASTSGDRRDDVLAQHIFISYSRADAAIATEIARYLERAGLEVWMDTESIRAGEPYPREITDAVLSCRKMLVLWSRRAAERGTDWQWYEFNLLLTDDPGDREKRIVPVLLDDVEPRQELKLIQAIRYSAADGLQQILAACDPSAGDERKPPHDWGGTGWDSPPLGFWGRAQDLSSLRGSVLDADCRLVAICGVAGIGKTTLVRAFLQEREVRRRFVVFCRTLVIDIPLPQLLTQAIAALSGRRILPRSSAPAELIGQLLEIATGRAALIVLDNLESFFDPSGETQAFQSAYADLATLLRRFSSEPHRGCVLLTCREELRVLAPWISRSGPVRNLHLRGVGPEGAREIFQARGDFRASDRDWDALADASGGHPFALQLASGIAATAHDGDVAAFLAAEHSMFDDLAGPLAWHVDRLTPEEREVVYWLAISRQPIALAELQGDLLTEEVRLRAANIVESLRQKISLDVIDLRFSLQPSMVEFMTQLLVKIVTERLVEKLAAEILLTKLDLLNSHALLTTQSHQHVRATQRRLILRPILDAVARGLPAGETIAGRLNQILDVLRRDFPGRPGYAAGNILNLLLQLGVTLRGHDFSGLCVWQADLEGAEARGVDFSGCQFATCSFTQTFGTIQAVAFGPETDVIAAGDTSGFIHAWQVAGGQLLYRLAAHDNWVRRLLFVAGGRFLVSAGDDQRICVWDVRTRRRLHTFEGHANWVGDLTFHEPSQVLASASEDGTVRLWDLASPAAPQVGVLEVDDKGVRSVAFRPDGEQLACGGSDGRLRTVQVSSRHVGPPVDAHDGSVTSLVYLPGNLIATGGGDGRLRFWEATGLENRGELLGSADAIVSLAVHAETNSLASAGDDGVVRLWRLDNRRCVQTLQGHQGAVRSIAFSPDGRNLLSGGDDQSVRIWSLGDGSCIRRVVGHVEVVWAVAWSPDGRRLASGHQDHRVRIWDVESGECLAALEGHSQWVQGVAWSPDGTRLASADTTVRLWEVETRRCLQVLSDHVDWVVSVAWSPEGSLLASGSRDGTVRLWDAWSGRPAGVLRGHQSWVWAVRFSPDGSRLASGGEDRKAVVWDVVSRSALRDLEGHRRGVWCVAWSPNGESIATAGVDGDICLWQTADGTEVRRLLGHTAWIGGVDFHLGGKLLASGSADGTVRVWDLDSAGPPRRILTGHDSWIWSVAWSPDGERLASGSQDETLRLWQVADGTSEILRSPRPYEGMRIHGATGLTEAQRRILFRLGAIDEGG